MKRSILVLATVLLILSACDKPDLSKIPNRSVNGNLQAMVSIPAGTAKNYIYDIKQKAFKIYKEEGIHSKMKFLPAPFNVGFIPSTDFNKSGKAIESIILTETLELSQLVEIDILGALSFKHNGLERIYIISNPLDPEKKLLKESEIFETGKGSKIMDLVISWLELYDNNEYQFTLSKNEALKIIELSLID